MEWPDVEPESPRSDAAGWQSGPHLKEEEFTRAVTLGLFDYLRKSRSQGFVVSLSGGADSSAVTCLVALMVELAWQDLGRRGFTGHWHTCRGWSRLPIIACGSAGSCTASTKPRAIAARPPGRRRPRSPGRSAPKCRAWKSTTWSSATSPASSGTPSQAHLGERRPGPAKHPGPGPRPHRLAAGQREKRLAALHQQPQRGGGGLCHHGRRHLRRLEPHRGHRQGIPLGLARWLETAGPAGLHPIAELAVVTRQPPTAEFRPPSAGQTDEEDLMPYRVLDAIERAAIRDKQSPREVFRLVRPQFPQYAPQQLELVGRAVLPPLVPQPVEARALRPLVPPGRREPRPQDLVPLPDPFRRFSSANWASCADAAWNSAAKHNLRVIRGLRSESCDSRNRWASARTTGNSGLGDCGPPAPLVCYLETGRTFESLAN